MTKFTTTGLVIKVLDIGEYDRVVTLLTADKGVIRAICRGVRRVKSKRLSASSLLTYSEFTLSENKDNYSVIEASVTENFFGLRNNIQNLALAQYLCDIFSDFSSDASETRESLRLLLNSLYFLSEGKKPPEFIKPVAELRLLTETGFMPDIVCCKKCGAFETSEMSFDLNDGSLICSDCPSEANTVILPLSCIHALRHIVFSDFDKLFSFSLSDDDIKLLSKAVEAYFLGAAGRGFKTLDFYNTFI